MRKKVGGECRAPPRFIILPAGEAYVVENTDEGLMALFKAGRF